MYIVQHFKTSRNGFRFFCKDNSLILTQSNVYKFFEFITLKWENFWRFAFIQNLLAPIRIRTYLPQSGSGSGKKVQDLIFHYFVESFYRFIHVKFFNTVLQYVKANSEYRKSRLKCAHTSKFDRLKLRALKRLFR